MNNTTRTIEALREAMERLAHSDGGELFDRDLEELKAPVRSKAVGLLNQRARSRKELSDRICQDMDVPEHVVKLVLDDLEAAHAIDDAHFAREWVRQRHAYKKKSCAVLRRELVIKGVAEVHIEAALATISEESEADILRRLVEKKASTISSPPRDRKEYDKYLRRIVGVAARRGFPQGLSMSLAKEALEHRIEELSVA